MKKSSSKSANSICKEGEEKLTEQKYQQALIRFNEALKIEPKHPASLKGKLIALISMAQNADKIGDNEVAVSSWEEAHELDPKDAKIMENLAKLRCKLYQAKHPHTEFSESVESYYVENFVFEGGGIRGLGHLGAIIRLFTQYVDRRLLRRVGGTSAGGIPALLIAFGYTPDEMNDEFKNLQFTDLMDGEYREKLLYLLQNKEKIGQNMSGLFSDISRIKNVNRNPSDATVAASSLVKRINIPDVKVIKEGLSLLAKDQFGLFPGNYLRERLIERLIQQKTGIPYCTFAELHALHLKDPKRYKDLYLIGTNISRQQVEVLSWETAPDDIISDAMAITVAIPGVFECQFRHIKKQGQRIRFSEDLFVDGGLIDNFAVWLFDRVKYLPFGNPESNEMIRNPYTLGMRLVNSDKLKEYTMQHPAPPSEKPKDLINYFFQIVLTLYNKQESDHRKYLEQDRTIYIYDLEFSSVQFDLDQSKLQSLIQNGDLAVIEQFPKLKYDRRDNVQILDVWQAIIANNSEQVEKWIQRGFNPEFRNPQGKTALDLAYEHRKIPMLIYLITHGVMQTHYGNQIQQLLRPFLNSVVIDCERLQKSLIIFEQKHQLQPLEENVEEGLHL